MDNFCKIMNDVSPLWGVCSFAEFSDHLIDCRSKSYIPDGTKSVIVALFPYYLGEDAYEGSNISRYAVVPDYNDFMKYRLDRASERLKEFYPSEEFVAFCGNSPFPEVSLAQRAGLGSKGRNGLLLTEKYGSWVFIGEIATTAYIEPSDNTLNLCDGCDLCIRNCPTGALFHGGFDPDLCLSAITQKKKPLTAEQENLIKSVGCVWGCDICQKSCPKNKGAQRTEIEEFLNGVKLCAEYGDDLTDRAYGWRGAKVIERNLDLLK